MTKAQKLTHLRTWKKHYQQLNAQYNELKRVLMIPPEAPVLHAAFECFTAYTDTLSELLEDKDKWLEWFVWENDMGERKHEATTNGHVRKAKPIETLEDLCDLIDSA